MKELIVSATVLLTVVLALMFGVGLGYACIAGILRAMGHRSESASAATLTTTTAQVSGD